jgi:hypothetical protein
MKKVNPASLADQVLSARRGRNTLAAAVLSACVFALPTASVHAEVIDQSSAVGEVSLVLGKAYLMSAGKARQLIVQGTPVYASDRVVTEANGHVHIRFIDDALVSVRPHSRLEVVRYDYDAAQPRNSSIKLMLEEGITRSISGKGASNARDRFRLNTPIAAIGVRGTDFVVSASPTTVRAQVNEGAIVLAPFSSDCQADSFGPCLQNAVELSGSSLQMIEFDESSGTPRLLPMPHERDGGLMDDELQLAVEANGPATAVSATDDKTAGTGVYLENVTSRRVTAEADTLVVTRPTPQPQPVAPPPPPAVVIPDFTPPTAVASVELTSRQLVWGRWSDKLIDEQRITLTYAEARDGREPTVGNGDYALFRVENGSKRVAPDLGNVSFALSSAQAHYYSEAGVVAMAVTGGSLGINFDTNHFTTQLNMNHARTGNVQFSAAGRVFDGGYFHTRSETERMAGAVSLDGSEAGYFFEKQLLNGAIQGVTLWNNN